MGDAVKGNSMHRTKQIGSVAVATIFACSALLGAARVAGATAQATMSAQPAIAEIANLEVYEAAPGAWIEVASSSSLVWTTYRDSQGNLVIELPNARPAAGLVNRRLAWFSARKSGVPGQL